MPRVARSKLTNIQFIVGMPGGHVTYAREIAFNHCFQVRKQLFRIRVSAVVLALESNTFLPWVYCFWVLIFHQTGYIVCVIDYFNLMLTVYDVDDILGWASCTNSRSIRKIRWASPHRKYNCHSETLFYLRITVQLAPLYFVLNFIIIIHNDQVKVIVGLPWCSIS